MEVRKQVYCYVYEGGEIEYNVGRQVKYKGGRVKGIDIFHGMSFDELLNRACEKLKINREGKFFYYFVKYDPNILLDLEDDEDVKDMVLHNDEFACVYIVDSAREEGVQREIADRENAKCCIGRDAVSSTVSYKVLCNTEQPRGFASRCVEWEVKTTFKVFNAQTFFEVDIKEGSCTCKAWQISGWPCEHACAVARMMKQVGYGYVDKPCDDEDHSYSSSSEPPKVKRLLERPQQRHIESKFRQKRHIHCSRCNGIGHNRATCTNPLA